MCCRSVVTVRRRAIGQRKIDAGMGAGQRQQRNYAGIVDAFYNGAGEIEVSAAITYEDGRRAVLNSTIAIGDVDEAERTSASGPQRAREAVAAAE